MTPEHDTSENRMPQFDQTSAACLNSETIHDLRSLLRDVVRHAYVNSSTDQDDVNGEIGEKQKSLRIWSKMQTKAGMEMLICSNHHKMYRNRKTRIQNSMTPCSTNGSQSPPEHPNSQLMSPSNGHPSHPQPDTLPYTPTFATKFQPLVEKPSPSIPNHDE
ncbi:hypothetical protein Cgig2_014513 [Carnegiea gigantea]|uniref:Uncharacterized protein n=1 Tax=Carnegiea gigantea TaxID=171969 RepID=A0A9Q1KEY9_9CARY|nr:hypothetical protein Cgig2_014513 [Carnegiea gigantea]